MIIQALRFGNADIGFLEGGPAWIGWQEYGLSVLAVETQPLQEQPITMPLRGFERFGYC